jgi:hypothetical protein
VRVVDHGWRLVAALLVAACLFGGGVPASAALLAKKPVPESLKATESSAEDIVDFALSSDREAVVAGAAELKAAAYGPAARSLTRAGVPLAKIASLKQRAGRVARLARTGSFIEIALSANAVSQLMSALYAHFRDSVPATVLTLDYLDREAQLRSLAMQRGKVAEAVRALGPTWTRLKPKVIAAGGAREASAYQKHVVALQRLASGPPLKVQAEAVHGLALVDEIEQVFVR